MHRQDLEKYDLPDSPGVYLFKQGRKIIYVGKASSLRDRVRSYFDDDLIATRGPRIVDMVTRATDLIYQITPTVLEALVREAALIKKYQPKANVEGKDDKSFLYAVITDEEIPRVLAVRGKDLHSRARKSARSRGPTAPVLLPNEREKSESGLSLFRASAGSKLGLLTFSGSLAPIKLRAAYGPFPSGGQLREGLRLIRRIFPFFDTPRPVGYKGKHQRAKIEFNRQIGHYPKEINRKEYLRNIRKVSLFLSGRTSELRRALEKEMKTAAKAERFEEASEARRQLFALDHIQDVSLIKDEATFRRIRQTHRKQAQGQSALRIEAYDTAHISGTNAVGVMVVVEDGAPVKRDYRTFRIKSVKNDDIGALKEVLSRRLSHPEWQYPRVIAVDGGKTHKKAAEEVLKEAGVAIPVVAVVKDEKHRPREVIGGLRTSVNSADIVLANSEAHRFALSRHRAARSRLLT